MTAPRKPRISSRKQPRQARSTQLVADILQAAVQVLAAEGAARFTTARVAERAGVSVGSIYQYFPNKAAILFRLQADEWRDTSVMLRTLLEAPGQPPIERLRAAIRAFFRSECEEAAMRIALADAAPLYRHAPEAHAHRRAGLRTAIAFWREALPDATREQRRRVADIAAIALGSIGKTISERQWPVETIDAYADASADMVAAYIAGLSGASP
ncbi:TetR family transcriptional regulator [Sphingomonas colocasiae]|uniref:TetR family transcriptional regulator n=1 Tax=Sphingomonas colocasiae TaxID=1848973 RepID=A0ABS7PYG9_9SPHN|nr:TetR family transcriptional regulator [Sphingomonas colocasiae]MBY8826156.1 TetR family transcriptional regulator [Sphingomonas colocasiae]